MMAREGSGVAGNGTSTLSRSAAGGWRKEKERGYGGVGLTERKGLRRAQSRTRKSSCMVRKVQSHLVLACLAAHLRGLELLTPLILSLTPSLCLSSRSRSIPSLRRAVSTTLSPQHPPRFDVDHYRQTFRDAFAVQMQH